MYQDFVSHYGESEAESRVGLEELGLSENELLTEFIKQTGGGVFKKGFLSLVSVRERVANLGGWERWLPDDAKIFGSSALGMFFAISEKSIWLVDCEYGQVVESDMTISEFINALTEENIREKHLREPVFLSWETKGDRLPIKSVLSPAPAISLAGSWEVSTLNTTDFSVYLSFTAQLFSPESGSPAEVYRL